MLNKQKGSLMNKRALSNSVSKTKDSFYATINAENDYLDMSTINILKT